MATEELKFNNYADPHEEYNAELLKMKLRFCRANFEQIRYRFSIQLRKETDEQ